MVSELRRDLIAERSRSKVQNMSPAWEEEVPLEETSGAEIFFNHARGQVDKLRIAYQLVGRKAQGVSDATYCLLFVRPTLIFRSPGGSKTFLEIRECHRL